MPSARRIPSRASVLVLFALVGCGTCADSSNRGPIPAACTTADPSCLARLRVGAARRTVPYFSTLPLDRSLPGITRAVIVVHGTGRNADSYFETMVTVADEEGVLPTTLVVAPHFQTNPDVACSGTVDSPASSDLYWDCNDWKHGEASLDDPSVDSYDVLDAFVATIDARLPDLERVTIAGHSAGGQVVNRFAAAHVPNAVAVDPPLRFVVANPSSYLYFDGRRPSAAASCDGPSACTLGPSSFADPYFDASNCASYDRYPYGLLACVGYSADVPDADLEAQYVGRDVVQLLGELDSDASTAADYADLDTSCGAMAEGPVGHSFRLQRGLVYHAYVSLLGATHPLDVVPGCGHSQSCMFTSASARAWIFGP